jgi:hypothetical protein
VSRIKVTTDGAAQWLECFADDPEAEEGRLVVQVEPGDSWDTLGTFVAAHQAEHGCAEPVSAP